MNKEELKHLIAECNNCIMDGSYSGDALLVAAALMLKLTDLYHFLDEQE